MKLPLQSLQVVTIESFGAGPYASMFLADLGAAVIKIENSETGGDASRGVGPYFLGEHDSDYFQTFNRNKKSVSLDLKTEYGKRALHAIVAKSDAVLNNLRGDLPAKLGLDYRSLKKVNPRIVCTHLSAYGRDNERAAWPGYDYLMQAETGFMAVTGEPGSPPTRMGLSIVDFITGLMSAVGLLSAVRGAQETGIGGDVDVSLFDAALHQLTYPATWFLNRGMVVGRNPRSAHPSVGPVQLYSTKDGWICIMCMKDKFWHGLLDCLGRKDLAGMEVFRDSASRKKNADQLTPILDAEFAKRATNEWIELLAGEIPVAPVYGIAEALDSEFVKQSGMIAEMPHGASQHFRVLANPLRLDGQRLGGVPCSALGADTEDVLAECGFPVSDDSADITRPHENR